jgi:hypothetical protein
MASYIIGSELIYLHQDRWNETLLNVFSKAGIDNKMTTLFLNFIPEND